MAGIQGESQIDTSTVISASAASYDKSSISPCARITGPLTTLFVDYCRKMVPIVVPQSARTENRKSFVAVLGASALFTTCRTWQ